VAKLGTLEPPPDLDPPTTLNVRAAITHAFVFGFRIMMLLCASLAFASAVVAWRLIPSRQPQADA